MQRRKGHVEKYNERNKAIKINILALATMSILFVGCQKEGVAEIQLESCIEGRLHHKFFTDTSFVWKQIVDDARNEPESFPLDPKYQNQKDQYYWGSNSDTTIWIEISKDSQMTFRHIQMDSVFERFYGSSYNENKILTYSISHSMRRSALDRIREIQSEYGDSVYPKNYPGNIYANDSCSPNRGLLQGEPQNNEY